MFSSSTLDLALPFNSSVFPSAQLERVALIISDTLQKDLLLV